MFKRSFARERATAVAYIGSGGVSVGIAHSLRSGPAKLLTSTRMELPLEERTPEHTTVALKQRLVEAGQKTLATYAAGGHALPISTAYAIISAPWTQSQTKRAEAVFDTEEYVSERLLSDLARRALKESPAPRANFLEANVMEVALNGYGTSHPEGKRAHTVALCALICVGDPDLSAAATEALRTVFPVAEVILRSGVRATLEAVRASRPQLRNCLILDVGDEGTAAIVIRDGVVESQTYIPEGLRSILARISQGGLGDGTLATMRMIGRDECSTPTCAAMQAALAKMEPDLAHAFGESLMKISAPLRLPNQLVLFAHPDISSWLGRFFARIDFTQFTETLQPFDVAVFQAADLSPSRDTSTQVAGALGTVGAADIELSVALALINKERSSA